MGAYRPNTRNATLPLIAAIVALLGACSGGGGAVSQADTPAAGSGSTLSGTVAVGAPMLDATITVRDANGQTATASAADDGSYGNLPVAGMTPPFTIQSCGLVGANYTCLYSVVQDAGTANVTPLTHAALALAVGQDPSVLFDGAAALPSADSIKAQAAKLKTALGDLASKAGIADADFATTAFSADRTGMDKLLDAVRSAPSSTAPPARPSSSSRGASAPAVPTSTRTAPPAR
ncbi:hypothetical protein SAMN06265795_102154 [Noviherbaspirillum humi]|uniref:Carboxypeptidase regulatory-like domain-containing protein n=1 Tax=Noviherbaspirillum humi TaxID=1688639 RepID=A0A239DH21_9BURK|nr:hypothetical protein [Noviherbaspirillum humi]SNS31023.1 hypothetical protein SAMN06265795_102154 [Noviherbaspirillum humi]